MLFFGVYTFSKVLYKFIKFQLKGSELVESYMNLKYSRSILRRIYNKGVEIEGIRINFKILP